MLSDDLPTTIRRFPDLEADNLFAVDAADRLILDEAVPFTADLAAGELVVIGDSFGALTIGAVRLLGATGVRVHQDRLLGEWALQDNAEALEVGEFSHEILDADLVASARVILLRLPRSLDALDEIAALIARFAAPDVVVIAGGRLKHMTGAMNEVLKKHFGRLDVTHARQKARVLIVREPLPVDADTDAAEPTYPQRQFHADVGVWIAAHGGVFAGTRIDIGTRYLLDFLPEMKADASSAIDLGSGSGLVSVVLAKARPELQVIATDQSLAAVMSSVETADANEVAERITVVRDVGLGSQPDASADLILLNPPFHIESTVYAGEALRLFEDAARVLKPGGELWTVFNTHLGYRAALGRLVGPTRQAGRNAKFTVTVSTRE